jgi:hypothetical protein
MRKIYSIINKLSRVVEEGMKRHFGEVPIKG